MNEEMVTFQIPRTWLDRINRSHVGSVKTYRDYYDDAERRNDYWYALVWELKCQAAEWLDKHPQHPDKNTPWGTLCTHTPDGFEVVLIGPDPQVPERWGVVFSLEDCAPYTVEYRLLTINKEQPSEPYHRL